MSLQECAKSLQLVHFKSFVSQKVETGLELIPPDIRPKGAFVIYLVYTQRNAES